MDQQLTYRKTALGDEAIQSRAKLSEHELRVILIMVDGRKTVGEIVSKFGNLSSVEQALYRLERDGFIQPTDGHVSDFELEKANSQVQSLFARAEIGSIPPANVAASLPDFIRQPEAGERAASAIDTGALFKPTATAPNATRPKTLPTAVPVINIPAMPSDEEVVTSKLVATTPPRRVADPASPASEARKPPSPPPAVVPAAKVVARLEPVAPDPQPSSWDEEDDRPSATPALPPLLDADDIRRHAARPPADEKPDSVVRSEASNPATKGGGKANPFVATGPATAGGFAQSWPEETAEKPAEKAPAVTFRFPRRRIGMGKLLVWFVIVLVLSPVIAFVVYPFDSHRAELEATLSRAIGQPVRIARLRASLSPSPAFVIDQLEVGDARDVVIRETRALPDLFALLVGRKSFREIRISGVKIPVERLGMLSAAAGGLGASTDLSVRELRFDGISLAASDLVFDNYSGRAEIDDGGRLRQLALVNADGNLEISVVGDAQGNALLIAEGTAWKPSPNSPFVFESFQASGTVSGNRFSTDKIEGRLFGGVVKGGLRFGWGEVMSLETDIASEFMNTPILLTALGVPAVVEGQLDGRVRFAVKAGNWAKLVASVPMEGDFLATRGNLRGMDLVEAVRRAGQQPYRGGGTKFDSLKGRFAWDGRNLRLSQIDLASGIVSAYGTVTVDAETQIDGEVNVMIRGSASRTREPVRFSGTIKDPLLTAGRQ